MTGPLPAAWDDPGWLFEALFSDDPEQSIMEVLRPLDPTAAPDHPNLIAAATTIADSPRQPATTRLSWARYAHSASERICRPQSEVSLHAARAFAQVLAEQDMLADAIVVHNQIIVTLERHSDVRSVVDARRALADLLYAHGRCCSAEQQLTAAYELWYRHRNEPDVRRRGATITTEHAAVLAGCGRHDDAFTLLRERRHVLDDPSASRRQATAILGGVRIQEAIAEHRPACTRSPGAARTAHPIPPISAYHELLYGDSDTTANSTMIGRLLSAVSWPRRVVRWIP
jgi:hypothetical protein